MFKFISIVCVLFNSPCTTQESLFICFMDHILFHESLSIVHCSLFIVQALSLYCFCLFMPW